MTSNRKIEANRRNSRKSCGPRTAAGKATASRNALKHGLAALMHRHAAPVAEIEQFALALCGDDKDPALFTQAVKVVANQLLLRAIRAQQVTAVERLRNPSMVPWAREEDPLLQEAKARSLESRQAEAQIKARLPELIAKYKDEIASFMTHGVPSWANSYEGIMRWVSLDGVLGEDHILPGILEQLLDEPKPIDDQILDLARKQIAAGERDENEAVMASVPDLVRLDRYERRAWSRQKRAILEFMRIKAEARSVRDIPAVDKGAVGEKQVPAG